MQGARCKIHTQSTMFSYPQCSIIIPETQHNFRCLQSKVCCNLQFCQPNPWTMGRSWTRFVFFMPEFLFTLNDKIIKGLKKAWSGWLFPSWHGVGWQLWTYDVPVGCFTVLPNFIDAYLHTILCFVPHLPFVKTKLKLKGGMAVANEVEIILIN